MILEPAVQLSLVSILGASIATVLNWFLNRPVMRQIHTAVNTNYQEMLKRDEQMRHEMSVMKEENKAFMGEIRRLQGAYQTTPQEGPPGATVLDHETGVVSLTPGRRANADE